MRTSAAALLGWTAVAVLLIPLAGVVPSVSATSAPLADSALQAELDAALASIEAEMAALVKAHPGLFAAPPAPSWQGLAPPLVAFDDAALALAELRVRAGLAVADGAETSALPEMQARAWVEAFRDGIATNATRLVNESAGAAVPPPGAGLEEAVWRWLPAYQIASRSRDLSALVAGTPAQDGPIGATVAQAARLEAFRVAWEHLPPRHIAMAPNATQLTIKQAEGFLKNAAFMSAASASGTTPETAFAHDAILQVSMEQGRRHAFGMVTFLALGHAATVQGNASAHATVRGLDLRPQLEAESADLLASTPSPLLLDAQQSGHFLLESVPSNDQAALGNASRYAAAIGQFAAVRLLRSLPPLPDVTVPLQTVQPELGPATQTSPGPAWGIAAAVLFPLAALARHRRQRC